MKVRRPCYPESVRSLRVVSSTLVAMMVVIPLVIFGPPAIFASAGSLVIFGGMAVAIVRHKEGRKSPVMLKSLRRRLAPDVWDVACAAGPLAVGAVAAAFAWGVGVDRRIPMLCIVFGIGFSVIQWCNYLDLRSWARSQGNPSRHRDAPMDGP